MEGPDVHSSNIVVNNGMLGIRIIHFRTGLLARQANGSTLVYLDDDTTASAATTVSKVPKEHFDFFPLTADVEERSHAVGRIPGSLFHRGGRSGTEAILATRLIDRPPRPTPKKGTRNEAQVVATVMTINPDEVHGALTINAVSIAASLAGLPFLGPIGGTHMALIDGQWVVFPRWSEFKQVTFSMAIVDRVVGGDAAVMTVEAQILKHADVVIKADSAEPTEAEATAGMGAAKPITHALCETQSKLMEECGEPAGGFPFFPGYTDEQCEVVGGKIGGRFAPILGIVAKAERDEALNELMESAVEELVEAFPGEEAAIAAAVNAAFRKTMRHHMFVEGVRMDGRTLIEIRTITAGAGVLPRVHGLALSQRGETQILGVTTLNILKVGQQLDNLSLVTSRRHIHHYNFPPYLAGETGRVGSPKRHEIGREHLAEIVLESQLPGHGEFPYVIRRVSETMSSNGSSPISLVRTSTLSLCNAGIPLKAPVAGIAMGLVSATIDGETKYCILTNILGAEDALGDMGLKVAGTREYVTTLQLNMRPDGIPATVSDAVLGQARGARSVILGLTTEAVDGPDKTAATASRIVIVKTLVDKIGEVIGLKGKMTNQIQEDTGAEILIEDDGTVFIGATDGPSAKTARQMVDATANPQMPEIGERSVGTVVKTTTFGTFISPTPGCDGLLHISQIHRIVDGKRVKSVEDVLNVGDKVEVKVAEIDPCGNISLHVVVEGEPEASAEQEEAERPACCERESRRTPRQHRRSSKSSGSTE